ncbi:MAG: Uma2 family endonuclease, partial [Acidobacteriaceae bacterium]|nr:Uma2 family endonuclease [Acidobacteriaceae bacterium]
PMPKAAHTLILDELVAILSSQLPSIASNERVRLMREAGWKFHIQASGADSVPGPDLMVVREDDARSAAKNNRWYEGVPLLVIEVISPSERRSRRLQKIGLYLEMGVPHVVEVDYTRRVVKVHKPDADEVAVYGDGDQMTDPFRATIREIFTVLD